MKAVLLETHWAYWMVSKMVAHLVESLVVLLVMKLEFALVGQKEMLLENTMGDWLV